MTDFFEIGKEILREECGSGKTALRRVRSGQEQMLSDRDLVRAAREALGLDDIQSALKALDELALRKAMDTPLEAA